MTKTSQTATLRSMKDSAPTTLLTVSGLGKTFGEGGQAVTAVQGLSFAVESGELVGFMGPNGAGKSTTMRMLAGFLQPSTGTASIAGHDIVTDRTAAQAKLGYLAEQPGVFEDLTGTEYLTFMAESHKLPNISEAVATAAKLTRCTGFLNRPLGELSKGMRQRVFFAGALVHNPPVLILDEPTDGLDPNQKHELRLVLKELARHKAVLLSTHILEEAEAICSRILVVHHGKKLLDTTPAELARQGKGDIQLAFRVLTQNKGHANA